ncbi:MAG: glycosyltransferase family 1 protein [Neisseriales bacterium]|nr:MAG: glycosyltransferase family 1 protein [Neisseriales bacterium]
MQRIYMNGYFYKEKTRGGVNRFASEMLSALDELISSDSRGIELILLLPRLNEQSLPRFKSVKVKQLIFSKSKYFWEQVILPLYVGRNFLINFANFAPIFKKNQLCVIHDALVFRYPESYSWKFRLITQFIHKQLVMRSKYIGTVSNFSAKEILNVIGQPKNPIIIFGNSADNFVGEIESAEYLQAIGLERGCYIFSVFSQRNSNYKNIRGYLEAIAKVNYTFVCVGSVEIEKKSMPNNLIQLGVVSDAQLHTLYQNAYATLVPSLYEGFGIPLLEAVTSNSPLIISDIPVFREIIKEAAIYFDPHNLDDIVTKIEYILENPELRASLIINGRKILPLYSWRIYAEQLKELIEDHIL